MVATDGMGRRSGVELGGIWALRKRPESKSVAAGAGDLDMLRPHHVLHHWYSIGQPSIIHSLDRGL